MSLTAGHQYISQWTVEDSIASVLSMNTLPVPVVCLTHCEGDEENVEKILRESARERGVRFHHVELADDGDKEEVISELVRWSSEHSWWVLITYTHLLEDPKTTWKLLTEVKLCPCLFATAYSNVIWISEILFIIPVLR